MSIRMLMLTGACFLLSACRPPAATAPMARPQAPERVTVTAGDELVIEVYGEKDLSGTFQVSNEGTIDYPLVGRIKVDKLTPPAVAKALREKLAAGFIKDPHVSVNAKNFGAKRKIYVWGQVRKTGTFSFSDNITMIEILTLAGGLTPMADKGGITLTRVEGGKRKQYSVPMNRGQSANYPLRPGDVVFVPERVF